MYNNDLTISVKNGMLRKVFLYMFAGLVITAISMYSVAVNSNIAMAVYKFSTPIILIELGLVFYINFRINKISSATASLLFLLYSAMNGLLFSVIMYTYSLVSIFYVLGVTMIIFIVMAIYGFRTKEDLSSYSSFFRGGLISLIIVSLLNIFLKISIINWAISVFAIVLFTALIAFDVNRIVAITERNNFSEDEYNKFAIIGALTLYLDFINLFLNLLRIFGKKR